MDVCERANEINAYYDGELPADRRAAVEEHLAACPACQAQLQQCLRLSGLLAQLPLPQAPSPELMQRLHQVANRQGTAGVMRLAEWLTGVAAAALVVFAVGLGYRSTQEQAVSLPLWETDAVVQSPSDSTSNSAEEQVAMWQVRDLSQERSHD